MSHINTLVKHLSRLVGADEIRASLQSIDNHAREIRIALRLAHALAETKRARAAEDGAITRTYVACPFCGIQTEGCSPTAVVKHEWRIGRDNYIRIYAVTGSSQHLIAPCCEGLSLHYEGLSLVAQRIT